MKIGICSVVLTAGVTCATAAQQVPDRPWQFDDGTIVLGEREFKTWRDYHTSDLFRGGIFNKCSTPFPLGKPGAEHGGFLGGGPSDCSMNNTNPSDDYDPSVVTYQIPVVVHVIRNDNGSQGNLSQSQVESGIRILNEDLNALSDTNGENGNDARIEFYLAQEDPQGNPSNGITYSNNSTWFNDGGSYWNTLAWDPENYLNVYTNSAGGYLGYVPFLPQEGNPGGNEDRVVVLWSTYGQDAPYGPPFDQGRTLTHEVGHYLGLFHVFDGCGGNCSSSGDRVCDTNAQSEPTWGCSSANSCGSSDNIDNYMDYSDDLCMEKFTPNQNRRMRCTLEHYRPQLYTEGEGGGGSSCSTSCIGDINENNVVDGGDLGLLVAAWGPCGETDCCADLDQNGTVGGSDLGAMLGAWGACQGDPCEEVDCNDGDPCTTDSCVNGNCVNEQIPGCGEKEGCGDPASGSCDTPNGSPYCNDAECCQAVCGSDPYCCDTEWDQLCADAVSGLCDGGGGGNTDSCGDPDSGSCQTANGTPYCNDQSCCEAVCAQDPFCCNTEWDQLCAEGAASEPACNS